MKDYLTGEQAAALLGITRRTLYRWAERGRVPPAWAWTREHLMPYVGTPHMKKGAVPRKPRCADCGTQDLRRLIPQPSRPGGYASYCRDCSAARMRRYREEQRGTR